MDVNQLHHRIDTIIAEALALKSLLGAEIPSTALHENRNDIAEMADGGAVESHATGPEDRSNLGYEEARQQMAALTQNSGTKSDKIRLLLKEGFTRGQIADFLNIRYQHVRNVDVATTVPGFVNPNNQEVLRKTGVAGNDHNQRVYVLRCRDCGHEYGANGSDIWQRRCPKHDRGAPGLSY
jgi:hypothetical protein